jgi:hypothetical protein
MKKDVTRKQRRKGGGQFGHEMPVFITSFEIAINERPFLSAFHVCGGDEENCEGEV